MHCDKRADVMRVRLKNGLSIQYGTRGIGQPVLLMHPVGLRGEFWRGVVAELENECRLVFPDFRGHGGSDAPLTPFTLSDLADDMAEILAALAGPALVVGCSMGGMVAQAMAVRTPNLVSGVVIANTAHLRNDQGRTIMEQRAQTAEKGMPATLDTTLSRWFNAAYQLRHPEKVALMRDWLLEADPTVHAWSWRAIRDLAFADGLRHLKMPAMVIAGLDDQSTPVAAMKAMASDIPNALYREIDSGHLAPLEQPKQFANCLREMLAQ
jgi:3-oxoadipate enol-lactonase